MNQQIENDMKEKENNKKFTVHMTYDTTRDNMSEIVLVWGTDESFKSQETFAKVWNHENNLSYAEDRPA